MLPFNESVLSLNESVLLNIHIALTAIMTGVIWVIQLVHYPSFHYVNMVVYTKFQKFHMFRISFIVMPVMILEIITAMLFFVFSSSWLYILNMFLLVLIWLSTALLSVPCHTRLEKAYSYDDVDKLVKTNWPRTLLWSTRLVLLLYGLISVL